MIASATSRFCFSTPLVALLSGFVSLASAQTQPQLRARPESGRITRVVVYSDRAEVTRRLVADCARGQISIALPSTLDSKTLSATLPGLDNGVVGLSYQEEATGARPQAAVLQQQIRQLDESMAKWQGELDAAAASELQQQGFRNRLERAWALQVLGKDVPVRRWDTALDLLRQQALKASQRRLQAESRRRELSRQRAELGLQLRRIEQARRRTTFQVTAFLRCRGKHDLDLSYVVPNATWRIAYQVRTARAGDELSLLAQAIIQQGTGESWDGVRLAVSTANLQRQTLPPKVRPLPVDGSEPEVTQKVLERRFEQREHLATAPVCPYCYVRSTKIAEVSRPSVEAAPMRIEARGWQTIAPDGREVLVTLEERRVVGRSSLETVPKLFPFVYRRLNLQNPFSFTMLAGPVSIFQGGTFMGTADVGLRAPGEPLQLPLGVVNELRVDRFIKKEQLEGASAFGSKKRLRHRYVIEVGNWTGRPQNIRVLENLPVAQAAEIQVSLDGETTPPSNWNRDDGILRWDLSLPARSKRSLVIAYTVSLPDAYTVTGY